MKRHILTLILSLVTLCSYGQSGRLIYGCVYGERKMPLQGAKITTPHGELICTTDQNGQFNAQSSTYIKEIVVLHDDYQTKYVKVDGSYLIIKMKAATQTYTQTIDDIVDAEEEVQTTNLIAEHEARIANERRAAAEEAAKIRAEKIAKLEAERAAAKEAANAERARIAEQRRQMYAEKQKGFGSIVELSSTLASNNLFDNASIRYIAGYRFNNQIYMGGGIGANIHYYSLPSDYYDSNNDMLLAPSRFSTSAFAYFKANFINRRCSPFIAVAVGYNLSKPQTLRLKLTDAKYSTSGIFANPQLGLNFRTSQKSSIYIAIGCQCVVIPHLKDYTAYCATIKSKIGCGVDMHIGFTF